MTPAVYLGAAAVVVATIASFAAGQHWTQAAWDREKLAASRATVSYYERLLERQAAAEATVSRVHAILTKARHEPKKPLDCPPTGDVRAVVLPGLGQRLRDLSNAASAPPVGQLPDRPADR